MVQFDLTSERPIRPKPKLRPDPPKLRPKFRPNLFPKIAQKLREIGNEFSKLKFLNLRNALVLLCKSIWGKFINVS